MGSDEVARVDRRSARPRVLVAEDDERLAALVARVLVEAGYEVVVARDGSSAFALAKGERFDLLLTDYSMPGLTGTFWPRVRASGRPSSRLS